MCENVYFDIEDFNIECFDIEDYRGEKSQTQCFDFCFQSCPHLDV